LRPQPASPARRGGRTSKKMFDLTQEIKLEPQWQKRYLVLRLFLYLIFILSFLIVYYLALFPSKYFVFSFLNFSSSKNTINEPRDSKNITLNSGDLKNGEKMIFDAALPAIEGSFSQIEVDFNLGNNSPSLSGSTVSVDKSYRSYFYETGDPVGFHDSSLIQDRGNFYIVSQKKLRKFSSLNTLKLFGYDPKNFEEVGDKELKYSHSGDDIISAESYPDDVIIKVGEDYYKFKNQELFRFVSSNAYLNQYSPSQSLLKNEDFLQKFKVSNELLGFASGTLLSYGQSVFIVSNDEILPVDSATTFEAMGYGWNDVIPATSEEIGTYKKGRLFTINRPHPAGTIFASRENGKYYFIENMKKREIMGEYIIKSYLNKNPVLVSDKWLEMENKCNLKKKYSLFKNSYGCKINIESLGSIIGDDYQFEITPSADASLEMADVSFKKLFSWNNFKLYNLDIINKIRLRYGLFK
jgi:hypothetical protein